MVSFLIKKNSLRLNYKFYGQEQIDINFYQDS